MVTAWSGLGFEEELIKTPNAVERVIAELGPEEEDYPDPALDTAADAVLRPTLARSTKAITGPACGSCRSMYSVNDWESFQAGICLTTTPPSNGSIPIGAKLTSVYAMVLAFQHTVLFAIVWNTSVELMTMTGL